MSDNSGRDVVNKNGWLWLAPEYFNKWRIFPRAFIMFYFWLAFETAMWFMGLPTPSPSQAAFASAIISAGAAWFGLYVNSGPRFDVRYSSNQDNRYPEYPPNYHPPRRPDDYFNDVDQNGKNKNEGKVG